MSYWVVWMIRAYLRRAWRVGRTYYLVTLITLLAVMVFVIAQFVFIIITVNPENIHGVKMPIEEAVAFTRVLMLIILIGMTSLMVSLLSATIVLGTIQADIQNGVFEVLFGNGVSDRDLIKALYIVGLSSFAMFYLLAKALMIIPLYIVIPKILSTLMVATLLAPFGVGLFTTGLSVLIGLSKPKYFKISTGIGSTKNLAFTMVSLPGLIILFSIMIPIITTATSATSYPATLLRVLNVAMIIVSIVMAVLSVIIAFKTQVNRVGLIMRGEEP
ncbi:hypothetical protein Vsou_07770 [Vulcanisaeta souniana JCM 11219]|uniref:ABC transporter permease n=2 Tax=Vulcanisaeta souniana JCM 11219 TaxID=1293586 RepID=A0ABN6SSG2_9CREN|nr:hypothetical protein Vsou_07770 [Vulcanisaeta souniana JCM 11219]